MSDNNQNPKPEELKNQQCMGGDLPAPPPENRMSIAWRCMARYLRKLRLWWYRHPLTPFNGVSRIHYYEARERYFSLVDLIRYQAKLCGLYFPDFDHSKSFEYPRDIENIENEIRKNKRDNKIDKKQEERCFSLLTCYESLIASRDSLTRRQGDLNRLWRTMARVRSRIIKIIVTPEMQSEQLYFCQEEAFRLGVENDPSVKSMLQDLAEAVDSKGTNETTPKYNCVLNALIERFNTIRTGRIHQQFVNVKTYTKAFAVLMLISVILIHNHTFIMDPKNNPPLAKPGQEKAQEVSKRPVEGKETAKTAASLPLQTEKKAASGQEVSLLSLQGVGNLIGSLFSKVKEYLQENMFAFIFFGGVTGGFFSVATRARTRDQEPGEDVYYSVYVLTKPFIGALGAIILYILINANLITQNILDESMVHYLRNPGTTAFGFAFIAGFSERIVFPQFR